MSPLAALAACWVLTALWPLVGDAGTRETSGLLFVTAGFVIGLALLSPRLLSGGRWRGLFRGPAAGALALMGLCSGAATAIYVSALPYTTPANAAICAQIEVLYSAALSAWLLGERPTWRQTAASALVVGGTALVVLHDAASPRWRGDLMILATPWLYQVSHVAAKRLPPELDAVTVSAGRVLWGVLALAPVCAWALAHGARWSWSRPALLALLAQGALMSSINFVLWYEGLKKVELSKATTFLLSYPALTLLFSWATGRELVGWTQVLGLTATFGGAAWTARLSRPASA